MSWPAKMMGIADIFEALTAADRPYKKAKTLSESLKILWFMKKDKHVDPDLFELFLRSGAYMEYAEQFLRPDQIDKVDINQYLQKISTAFRRYVLNTLAKLDTIDDGTDLENQSSQSNTPAAATTESSHEMIKIKLQQQQQQLTTLQASMSSTLRAQAPTKLTSPAESVHNDPSSGPCPMSPAPTSGNAINQPLTSSGKVKRFAFNPQSKRMEMEVLDSPPKQAMEPSQDRLQQQVSPSINPAPLLLGSSRTEASPFSRRNDVIRTSLSHLSAALHTLELPVTSTSPTSSQSALLSGTGVEDSRTYLNKLTTY